MLQRHPDDYPQDRDAFPDEATEPDRALDPRQDEGLEDLYYRLEGIRNRLLYLDLTGAPASVRDLEGAREQRLQQVIDRRIRSIAVRRNLDEQLLLEELQEVTGAWESERERQLRLEALAGRVLAIALEGIECRPRLAAPDPALEEPAA
jgi:hypothetical protein